MTFFAHKEHSGHGFILIVQFPAHVELLGKLEELRLEYFFGCRCARKLNTHEKHSCLVIVVCRSFVNIAAVGQKESRNGVDNPRAVHASDVENVRSTHDRRIVAQIKLDRH